ncbi:MAG TPA: heat-inducible transcription repressor HrcA [Firmicutes bacterium]|nr:heat-inducible transcription repressor HrcA [Candidatus Fermentithermobacillaceae bacterium]
MTLDDRKARVLRAVVEEHIETGLPVGSRTIAKRYALGVSPATIRNEMAELEETGYLDKPHTSSGRIPSDRGYRFYVDELMPQVRLHDDEVYALESLFRSRAKDVVSLLKETVKVISDATNYLAFVLGPDSGEVTFNSIHLLPASSRKALLVIITDVGYVETCLIDAPDMTIDEMRYVSDMLTRNLGSVRLDKVADRAQALIREEASRYAEIIDQAAAFLRGLATEPDEERLFVGGTANLLSQPEFRDVGRVKELLSAIESEGLIQYILSNDHREGDPIIRIGAESPVGAIRDLSLVYGRFTAGNAEGRIGLLGPRRMDYARSVAIIKFCERRLSESLS